ncbi:MAG: ATP-binding protein [Muribaculaceae bacterium]|nr:ATP-binding protein [Muribaculaceae bacterium]
MILSLRLKNFYSIRDYAVLDFTAETTPRKLRDHLPGNLIEFNGDKFVNIIGLFGSNAAGKSNIIKTIDFARQLILTSHLNNEGDKLNFETFKFDEDKPSEFYINFVSQGIEYEYSFELHGDRIISESLYYYPNKRRSKVFSREKTYSYTHRKGLIQRPTEVETNTGAKTLFLSRASSMNRPIAQAVYRFFLNEIAIGISNQDINQTPRHKIEANKDILLKAFEVSDSDIIDLKAIETTPGNTQLFSYHRENPNIPFDFAREESEGTKRLLNILLILLDKSLIGTTIFLDEFDLKLHIRLAELILDVVRASHGGQMVFTSHNPLLINPSLLRNEQIVFVSKDESGNSEFVPLSDYEDIKKNTDLMKAYLQGRFDAVPYIGDIYPILTQLLENK